ncbi:hypothetical protein QYF36_014218 [Acer negundo]|nr:hypothetical protein QYF36_014218 [Acer negundo]
MLPSLEELHLPACGLSTIPSSVPLVNLTSLSVLELSNNGFNSSMPSWLFNLTSLVYVDLSSNNFQGELPDQFADLKFIQYIDLSENSFIEDKETSYIPSSKKKDDEDENFYKTPLFYSSIVLGFILGFWGFCGTLILKKSWRVAYFGVVDDMKERLLLVVSLRLAHLRRPARRQ